MSDKKFILESYHQIKTALQAVSPIDARNVYALSFYFSNADDDPRLPTITVGYNTFEQWIRTSPGSKEEWSKSLATDAEEAKWNFAFWLQNELIVIGGEQDELVGSWIKDVSLYYTDKQEEDDYDSTFAIAVQIQERFIEAMIVVAQSLHSEMIIEQVFGRAIPVVIHELEYYEKPVEWTTRANPPQLAKEFRQWVASF